MNDRKEAKRKERSEIKKIQDQKKDKGSEGTKKGSKIKNEWKGKIRKKRI